MKRSMIFVKLPLLVRGSHLAPAIPTGSACHAGTTCKDRTDEAQPRPNTGCDK